MYTTSKVSMSYELRTLVSDMRKSPNTVRPSTAANVAR